ncbi:hypothetical protein NMG60_11013308 [Bertholletia excelsa]
MSRDGDWMCGRCQYLNFKKWDNCQRCGCSKFGGGADISSYGIRRTEVLAGDWYCTATNCGAHNYASRTSCFRCNASRNDCCGYLYDNSSVPPGWKAGDWVCSSYGCGLHNYASRTECYKCGTPRDYGKSTLIL